MYKKHYILVGVIMWLAAACTKEVVPNSPNIDAVELSGIRVSIDNGMSETRSSTPTGTMPSVLEDSIGRTSFGEHEQLVFTKICRFEHPLTEFTYTDVKYNYEGTAWKIDNSSPKIYWSDGSSEHTFIGYCLPHKTTEAAVTEGDGKNFDWVKQTVSGADVYYGSIGDPTNSSEKIRYDETDEQIPQNLRKEDLLLTHNNGVKNQEGEPIADIVCHHALASVRVTVSLNGFSTSSTDKDAQSKVSDLYLANQPVMYKWRQQSSAVEALTKIDDQDITNWNQKKDMYLWHPHPDGVGSGSGRSFTFYGINVPGQYDVPISFKVTYPNPLNPSQTLTKTYKADLIGAQFKAGFCTSITIVLNHKNEELTVAAEYIDWEYVETPDQGNLFKNSTFLDPDDFSKVTIHSDSKATADDATWLYSSADRCVRDIYGHSGLANDPYVIKNAAQFLSFCYEVNNGYSFEGQYITLDAGLYLQKDENSSNVTLTWPGIGVLPTTDDPIGKPFQGTLLGGVRLIKLLKGAPLFNYVGPKGHIDQLLLEDVIFCTGNATYVELNQGLICGGKVGTTKSDNQTIEITGSNKYRNLAIDGAADSVYVGSFCARNDGCIIACYSTVNFKATNADRVGGVVGLNNGDIICNYAAHKVQAPKANALVFGIAGGMGKTTDNSIDEAAKMYFSLFDRTVNSNVKTKEEGTFADLNKQDYKGAYAVITTFMQSNRAVGTAKQLDGSSEQPTLNGRIAYWTQTSSEWSERLKQKLGDAKYETDDKKKEHLSQRYFVYHVANYPWVY